MRRARSFLLLLIAVAIVLPRFTASSSGSEPASAPSAAARAFEPLPFYTTEPLLGLPDEETGLVAAGEDAAAIADLGRLLFFDPILSRDRTVSCATCHEPEHGYASPDALSIGIDGQSTTRNAPSLLNRAYGTMFMWDGRFATLEEQVLDPIHNPKEMALPHDDAVARLAASETYSAHFERLFPGEGATVSNLGRCLAGFVRHLRIGDSPVDRFQSAHEPLDAAVKAGLWIYESKGRCWQCHSGPNFTDEAFHNTGVGAADGKPEAGREAITGSEADRGAFKTPTLRGLSLTAPYMHDGSLETLEEVVEFYRTGGHANSQLDPIMAPIELSDEDVKNLVAFLESLSERAPGGGVAREAAPR